MSTLYICTRPNWSLLTLWRSLESTPTKMVPNLNWIWKSFRLNFVRGFELDQNWKVSLPYLSKFSRSWTRPWYCWRYGCAKGDKQIIFRSRRSKINLDSLALLFFLTHYLQLLGKLQTHRKLLTCKSTEKHLTYKSTENFSPANLQ